MNMIRKQLLVEEFKMSSSLLEIIGGRRIENNEKEGSSSKDNITEDIDVWKVLKPTES